VLEDAVRYATDRGALVVLAAGNAGSEDPNACHPTSGQCGGYPAYYATTNPGILSVGASDENDALYAFSNRGSWVRVAAPGCVRTTTHGGGYATACGTSIAAPLVAGIAGLLESWKPELTNLELKGAIESGATAVGGLGVATGRVDAYAALLAAGWAPPPPLVETSPAPESERAEPGRMAGPVLAGRATVGGVLRAAVRGAQRVAFQWQVRVLAGQRTTSSRGGARRVTWRWQDLAGARGPVLVLRPQLAGRAVRVVAVVRSGAGVVRLVSGPKTVVGPAAGAR
jgi:subtilisin family serine protease